MKIVHVVTLITPECTFGGPVTVAANQARELIKNGHDVTLMGGVSGYPQIPVDLNGVPAKLYPAHQILPGIGFSGLWTPGLVAFLRRHRHEIDVMHVHLTRDFVTLPAARWAVKHGVPLVIQCHSQVDESERLLAKPLDLFWTRPTLRRASKILYLTDKERRRLIELAGTGIRLEALHNGVPFQGAAGRSAVSAGASPDAVGAGSKPVPHRPEVLFVARLHASKRPKLFAEVAFDLLKAGSPADFTVIGPDGGEAAVVDQVIQTLPDNLRGRLRRLPGIPPNEVAARIEQAAVYVLPSINETFPMSALEAMSVGRPVIMTEDCGLAPAVRRHSCGVLVDESREQLSLAISGLLADPVLAQEMGQRARRAIETDYSMDSVINKLEAFYYEIISPASGVRDPR
jgi:glycosyltransferase involved in cell wall biosynthesis